MARERERESIQRWFACTFPPGEDGGVAYWFCRHIPRLCKSLLRGWLVSRVEKGRRQSRTVVVDGNHYRATSPRVSRLLFLLVKARWGNRCSTDYDTRERGRFASGDIVSALDTPLRGLHATDVNIVVENSFRWLLPEFHGIDKISRGRSRFSWIANWLCFDESSASYRQWRIDVSYRQCWCGTADVLPCYHWPKVDEVAIGVVSDVFEKYRTYMWHVFVSGIFSDYRQFRGNSLEIKYQKQSIYLNFNL